MAYTTAFMETATIANYKCYTFDDWHYAATIGSLFYAIYFIVSFPMFYIGLAARFPNDDSSCSLVVCSWSEYSGDYIGADTYSVPEAGCKMKKYINVNDVVTINGVSGSYWFVGRVFNHTTELDTLY